ncbi:hypothetical protein Pla110_21990 [Polystyrenella longa]|uniref:Uncharacterized protein n=1 Tax=Polystyrenella longa TaxID=2528007 RepID=A0A518CMM4_9PLAN|nr:hypothetical protein [Polystyrenella longa]QDU80469.1 hypothetical protein Pla110_21990 [Polystyrenella longa]
MGWLFRVGLSRKELIAERTQEWERTGDDGMEVKTTCLANCFRGNTFSGVLWSVWERTFQKDDGDIQPTERWIACDLLRYQSDAWGYKDMDEAMGPYYYSCPMKYLEMVPMDQFGGNTEWRETVHSHHERRRQKRRNAQIESA